MKIFVCAAALTLLAAWPAGAQYQSETPSDRYTRDPAQPREQSDQQAQTPNRRDSGKVETLRDRGMSSPNVQGEAVPENPETGVPDPRARGTTQQGGSGPRP